MPTITALADLHGYLPDTLPVTDVVIIAGDICPLHDHRPEFQAEWLATTFADWLEKLAPTTVVGIAGEHDLAFATGLSGELPWTYLRDSAATVAGLSVWGTPWVGYAAARWAFQAPRVRDEAFLAARYQPIPPDLDILISHASPFGFGDQAKARGRPIFGSRALAYTIAARAPRLVISGHIHRGRGVYPYRADNGQMITIANASVLDEDCYPYPQPPLVFELPADGGPARLMSRFELTALII